MASVLRENKKRNDNRSDGGTAGRWGQKRDKVEQGVAPHAHLHSLEVNLRSYLFNFSVSSNGAGSYVSYDGSRPRWTSRRAF